ncbi:serine hydrolase domain-containing protein [Pseudonocardia humida]|uniref:Beta-lactamase family protein n=1 Tax=Pseudonocardia humida TaxID=2800819 RepID=A0ABT0ZXS5_9PSEU|nr:serine hydrolase domain-containing protein [Pseudonocardia humida]MCO1655542.1 beta-lactamase family protein [Pseudonocardia humida]
MSDRTDHSPGTAGPSSFTPRRVVSVLAALAVLGGGTALAASAEFGAPPANAAAAVQATPDAVQRGLDGLVRDDGFPGALAAVRDADGHTRHYTAGVGDLATGEEVPVDGRVRIASNTKMFTAVVVLQLVQEGLVDLDAPIETYLPGLVRGEGIDGRVITVRQLLQHTSGLADYDDKLAADGLLALRDGHHEPRELVELGLSTPALFAPGTGWAYGNTNYVLAGLLVEEVTGNPVGDEITERVIDRIGLEHTYWPAADDRTIRGPHPHGYVALDPSAPPVDFTEQDVTAAWAAGALISTPSDVNRFMTALVGGELLEPAELEQMQRTVDAPEFDASGDARYGLGLATFSLSCGGTAWTHGGTALGYQTANAVTAEGRAAALTVTALPGSLDAARHVDAALDTALCG